MKDKTCKGDFKSRNVWMSRSSVGQLDTPDQVNALANTTLGYKEEMCI